MLTDNTNNEATNDKQETQDIYSLHRQKTVTEIDTFSFGYRFYYWPYYKDNEEEDYVHNPGKTYKEMYIHPVFDNLRQEILAKLDYQQYKLTYKKCKQYSKCDEIRSLKSGNYDDIFHYDIRWYTLLTIERLMSVVFYTDYYNLCYKFSKSFRKIKKDESLESIKIRNGKYFWWSKLLRETVEYFGDDTKNSAISTFYHGTSRLYFSQFNASFYGPTSTSCQIEVATMFSDDQNGVLLELQSYDDYELYGALYFNCSFLSCFGNEDERLFIGGFRKLKFYSIRVLNESKQWENFHFFIAALTKYGNIIKGERLWNNDTISKQQKNILNKLINHRLGIKQNHCNNYINSTFDAFVNDKDIITIDLRWMNRFYKYFSIYFISNKNKSLLQFDYIAKLYSNCNTIITVNQEGHYAISITAQYFQNLLPMMDEINITNLECIKIINAKYHKECASKFEKRFNEKGWMIQKIAKEKYCDKNTNVLLITKQTEHTTL